MAKEKSAHAGTALAAIAAVIALLALVMPFTSTVAKSVAEGVTGEKIATYIELNRDKLRGPKRDTGGQGEHGQNGNDGGGGWQRLDRPLRTVTTIDRFALVTPAGENYRMRMLQVPELRRAMGFGKDVKLDHGTRRDRIRILGNGVCPPVMKAVVESLTDGV